MLKTIFKEWTNKIMLTLQYNIFYVPLICLFSTKLALKKYCVPANLGIANLSVTFIVFGRTKTFAVLLIYLILFKRGHP